MNRKLVNGLLLLSVATAACGTFTSCKDADEDYKNEILVDLNNYQQRLAALEQQYPALANDINKILAYIGVSSADELQANGLSALINQLIDENVNPDKVYGLISSILQKINAQVTDITLNQTYNPIFGSLNLPIGLSTSILANYYGDATATFPFAGPTEVGGDVNESNAAALAALPFTKVSVDGIYMNEGSSNNNLGQLYVTVNPFGLDMDNYEFSLVNSQDEAAPVTLTPAITDEVLTHGYTRSLTSKNGFYRMNANADLTALDKLAINIEPGLKESFKDFIKNPGKQNLADLGLIIFHQMEGFLPAYGIKATWSGLSANDTAAAGPEGTFTPDTVKCGAVSKYEIAATAFKPLGFEAIESLPQTSKRLPTFGPVSDAVNSVLADMKEKAKIDFKDSKLEIKDSKIEIVIDGLTAKDAAGNDITVDSKTITLGYKNGVAHVEGDNETALNPFIKDLEESVNKMLTGMQGDINGQLGSIIDDLQAKLDGKLGAADKLLSKYNTLAGKVNNFLANPFDYVTVSMVMKGADGDLHRVSTNPNDPTYASGNGAAVLYLTSPTAELIVPFYKKAVANVTTGKVLADVIPGNQVGVAIQASDLQQGLNQIVYSAMDYRGKTNTRFFYIYKN